MRSSLSATLGVRIGGLTRALFRKDDRFGIDEIECFDPPRAPEVYGPTDVNAQIANGNVAVGVNADGTITVFRYPSPPYYDQIKCRTASRDREFLGEDFDLVCSKEERVPIRNWCLEGLNTDTARYLPDPDAIAHLKRGVDSSTGTRNSVATAVAFQGRSAGHRVGGPAWRPGRAAIGPPRERRERLAQRVAAAPVALGRLRGVDAVLAGLAPQTRDRPLGDGGPAGEVPFRRDHHPVHELAGPPCQFTPGFRVVVPFEVGRHEPG